MPSQRKLPATTHIDHNVSRKFFGLRRGIHKGTKIGTKLNLRGANFNEKPMQSHVASNFADQNLKCAETLIIALNTKTGERHIKFWQRNLYYKGVPPMVDKVTDRIHRLHLNKTPRLNLTTSTIPQVRSRLIVKMACGAYQKFNFT